MCYEVDAYGLTYYILAVDHADEGMVVSQKALQDMGGDGAVNAGVIEGNYVAVDYALCYDD